MRVLVAVKRVVDYNARVRVKADKVGLYPPTPTKPLLLCLQLQTFRFSNPFRRK